MTPVNPANSITRILGGLLVNDSPRGSSRSPVLAILGSLVAGAAIAVVLTFTLASGGSEPLVTGSVLFAFGLGWGLMTLLSTRFSAQPQAWTAVPAAVLGSIGLGLMVFQPGAAAMDLLSWVWPPALAVLAIWMVVQVRRQLRGRGRWLVIPVIATLLIFAIGGGLAIKAAAIGASAMVATGVGYEGVKHGIWKAPPGQQISALHKANKSAPPGQSVRNAASVIAPGQEARHDEKPFKAVSVKARRVHRQNQGRSAAVKPERLAKPVHREVSTLPPSRVKRTKPVKPVQNQGHVKGTRPARPPVKPKVNGKPPEEIPTPPPAHGKPVR